jgi:hypothetical protein
MSDNLTARQALDALYIPLLESAVQTMEAANEMIVRISHTESVVNELRLRPPKPQE